MPYRIAGVDVHKRMLAVVVADVEVECEYEFERRMWARAPTNCARWPGGSLSAGLRKS